MQWRVATGGRKQSQTGGCGLQGVVRVWVYSGNSTNEHIIVPIYSCVNFYSHVVKES